MDAIEGFYCISIRANVVFKLFPFIGTLGLFSRSEFDHSKTDMMLRGLLCVDVFHP